MGLWKTGRNNNHYIAKNKKPLTGLNLDTELTKKNTIKRYGMQSDTTTRDIDGYEDDKQTLEAMARRGNIKAKGALFWQYSTYRTSGAIAEKLNLNDDLKGYPTIDSDWGDVSKDDREKIIDFTTNIPLKDFETMKKSIVNQQQNRIQVHRPNTQEGFKVQMNRSIDDIESDEIRKFQENNSKEPTVSQLTVESERKKNEIWKQMGLNGNGTPKQHEAYFNEENRLRRLMSDKNFNYDEYVKEKNKFKDN